MHEEQRINKTKRILEIDTNATQDPQFTRSPNQLTEKLQIKLLRSTKNQFQMREMFFRSNKHQEGITKKYSRTLSQLEKEKEQLIESIHILKTGAISAIAQKVDNIQRLKEVALSQNQQEIATYEYILKNSQATERELQINLKQLHNQIQQERKSLTDILEQKESRIQELQQLVGNLRSYIQELESNQKKIIQELKQLKNKIYYLSKQVQEYTISQIGQQQREKNKINQQMAKKSQQFTSQIKFSKSASNFFDVIHTNDFSTQIEEQYAQKIHWIKQRHLLEILDIKQFYENKIANLRNTYNIYLAEQINQKDLQRIKKEKQTSNLEEIPIDNKILSRYQSSNNTRHFTHQRAQKTQKISEPQIHILKQEINLTNQCVTPLKHRSIQQHFSEFTRQHFQNPFISIKQKSTHSSKSIPNNKKETTRELEKQQIKLEQECQKPLKETKWQMTRQFASGLILGLTLQSFIRLAIKGKILKRLFKYFRF